MEYVCNILYFFLFLLKMVSLRFKEILCQISLWFWTMTFFHKGFMVKNCHLKAGKNVSPFFGEKKVLVAACSLFWPWSVAFLLLSLPMSSGQWTWSYCFFSSLLYGPMHTRQKYFLLTWFQFSSFWLEIYHTCIIGRLCHSYAQPLGRFYCFPYQCLRVNE